MASLLPGLKNKVKTKPPLIVGKPITQIGLPAKKPKDGPLTRAIEGTAKPKAPPKPGPLTRAIEGTTKPKAPPKPGPLTRAIETKPKPGAKPKKTASPKPAAATPAAPATVTGTAPTFDPNGNESWNGATGLSKDAVNWLSAGADSQYFDDYNAANKIHSGFVTSLAKQAQDAGTDRMAALRRLGWDNAGGRWLDNDTTTGLARDTQNQQFDFGNRGLLHSSEYAHAANDLTQNYNDQKDAIVTAGARYDASIQDQSAQAQDDYNSARLAAIRSAVQRRAATYGTLI